MILDESREVHKAFLTTRDPLKSSQSEDLVTSKKHPLEAIGTHKIIPKIHKSLVLAHNIHKDCPRGVASAPRVFMNIVRYSYIYIYIIVCPRWFETLISKVVSDPLKLNSTDIL